MTREDFYIDGLIFQSLEQTANMFYRYQVSAHLSDRGKMVITIYRLFVHTNKRVNDELYHIEFVKGGIQFWTVLGELYAYSRIYKFSEFKVISTPSTVEPSEQSALSLQTIKTEQ